MLSSPKLVPGKHPRVAIACKRIYPDKLLLINISIKIDFLLSRIFGFIPQLTFSSPGISIVYEFLNPKTSRSSWSCLIYVS